jgi:molybdenum cofactor cytidylyltransferase
MNPPIEGILLAAGESSRMGYPKPLLEIDGSLFIERTAQAVLSVAEGLVVVLGAHAARIRPRVPRDPRIRIVENPDYARGQLSSLKVAIRSLAPGVGAALVHLADHPAVRPETFRLLVDAFRRSPGPIMIVRYQGRRGHPVIFDRAIFAELLDAPESEGARFVVNADPSRVGYVDVEDAGVVLDLDTPSDLQAAGLPPPPSRS